MCGFEEHLIQQSWFDVPYGREDIGPQSGVGGLVNGRARASEYLNVLKPFNYDNCYLGPSSANKPLLQHTDMCQVSCRADNGFIGSAVILYKCVGATGLFVLQDSTTGIISCSPQSCQVATSLC